MGERNGYAAGTPCWVDVSTPDMDATKAFYAGVFGWTAFTIPQAGGYTMFNLGDKQVAAAGPVQDGSGPPAWSTYIASDDADATAAAIQEAGGTVLVEPMDVFDSGRMLFAQDPTGGAFGVWQARNHKGSQLANEPGSFTWNELTTDDVDRAQSFYGQVFGWDDEPLENESFTYHVQNIAGAPIGGIMPRDPAWGDIPTHWDTYFAVESTDHTVAKAKELGASVRVEPMDTPYGRMAELVDPVGAAFAVIEPAQPAG